MLVFWLIFVMYVITILPAKRDFFSEKRRISSFSCNYRRMGVNCPWFVYHEIHDILKQFDRSDSEFVEILFRLRRKIWNLNAEVEEVKFSKLFKCARSITNGIFPSVISLVVLKNVHFSMNCPLWIWNPLNERSLPKNSPLRTFSTFQGRYYVHLLTAYFDGTLFGSDNKRIFYRSDNLCYSFILPVRTNRWFQFLKYNDDRCCYGTFRTRWLAIASVIPLLKHVFYRDRIDFTSLCFFHDVNRDSQGEGVGSLFESLELIVIFVELTSFPSSQSEIGFPVRKWNSLY